jgi:hypothetical protein
MMHEDPACRWDMATSARRLGGIARAGAPLAPRVDRSSATRVLAMAPLEPTQALAPTQRVEVIPPVTAAPTPPAAVSAAAALIMAKRVVTAPVVQAPVVKPLVVKAPLVEAPVVRAPVVKPLVVKAPLVEAPVVKAPVVAPPVVKAPVVAPPVVKAPVVAPPVVKGPVVAPLVVSTPVVEKPVAPVPVVKAPVVDAPVVAREPVAEPPFAGPPIARLLGGWGSEHRLKPILLVALLLGVLGAAYLLSPMGDPSRTTASPPSTHPRVSAKPTAASTPNAPETHRASTPAPGATVAAPALNADRQLAAFVNSYYANVTGNRDITWAQLSPVMQAFARGRSDYDGFWQTIRAVRVNQVQADASARTAVVSLTYTKRDGSTSNETHNFTFVRNGTGYLIQSDR